MKTYEKPYKLKNPEQLEIQQLKRKINRLKTELSLSINRLNALEQKKDKNE